MTVKVVPWDYDFTKEDYDWLFISNGPGHPHTVKNIKKRITVINLFLEFVWGIN